MPNPRLSPGDAHLFDEGKIMSIAWQVFQGVFCSWF